jgi:aminopeptidase
MEQYLQRYVRLIIDVQLQLREGDSLSINTQARSMGFARLLAREAVITTRLPVTIVETEAGKVIQAYPIDPKEKDLFRPEVQQAVMCHIVDLDDFPYEGDESTTEICQSAASLARHGFLADPIILDRRISAPWANIPYPGPMWAEAMVGHNVLTSEAWELFATLFRLDTDFAASFWQEQANLLSWRKRRLDPLVASEATLTGDGWIFTARLAERTHFSGGSFTLPGGRTFIPTLPIQGLVSALDSSSARGTVRASRPFWALGERVVDATITLEGGKAVAWDAAEGKGALDALFAVDEGAMVASSIILADTATLESRYLAVGRHPHFFHNTESALCFGGSPVDTLDSDIASEDLEGSALCDSLVRLIIPIGGDHLSVSFTLDGDEIVMMEEGVFHE